MDCNLRNISVYPSVLRKGKTGKMFEAEHLTSALTTWEISLCESLRAQIDFKESFKCWMIWCILNDIFAGRVYVTWKKLGQKHQELIRWSKQSAGHAHGSSELPNHCCQGVLLPQALLISFTFLGPNHGDCHLMGCFYPRDLYRALVRPETPCLHQHQLWQCNKPQRGCWRQISHNI